MARLGQIQIAEDCLCLCFKGAEIHDVYEPIPGYQSIGRDDDE